MVHHAQGLIHLSDGTPPRRTGPPPQLVRVATNETSDVWAGGVHPPLAAWNITS